ncbi:PAS domain S-box protein, partial [Methylobacterium sp. WL103]
SPADLAAACTAAAALAPDQAKGFFRERFSAYRVVRPADGTEPERRAGFLTGYFEPQLDGSLTPGPGYTAAVLARPDDLVTLGPGETRPGLDPALRAGRQGEAGFEPYPDRAAIEDGAIAARTHPLLWLRDAVDLFVLQVQGSGRVRLPDGTAIRVLYDGKNGRPYTSIGKLLVGEGHLALNDLSLARWTAWLRAHPDHARRLMRMNASYIFFRIEPVVDAALGPPGAAGAPLSPGRSMAVDSGLWRYGLPFWLDGKLPGQPGSGHLVIAADTGVERWLAARGRAIVEDGVAVRFIGSVRDITEHKAADLTLKATEERYRLAARATTDAIWDWDLVADQVRWNEALTLAHGHDLGAVVPQGAWWLAQIHPEDRDRIARSIHAAIDGTVETWTDEYRFRRGDDSYAAVIDRGYIIRDDAGRAVRMIGAMLDITRRNETERRLRQNQAQLDTVLQTMPVGILLAEAPSGRIVFGNPRLERILGHPTVQAEDRDGYGAYRAYRADGSPVPPGDYPLARITAGEVDHAELEAHYQRPDGSRRWIEIIGEAVKDSNGVTIGAVVAVGDIEDRKRAAQQQDILHHELGHRLKNTLALVQAIATQTLRNVTDLDAAREALSARLVAMGKAHDILLSGESESAGMEAVLRGALSIHDDGGPQRFRLSGPDLAVGPKAALSLALMAHELATNAVKYGALSVPDGSVVLRWEVEGRDRADGSAVIHLLWREQGGPSVVEPTRKGFGTRLIERGLVGAIGGTVRLAYPESGVTCTVTAPLSGLLES